MSKTILITGACSGLGNDTAKTLSVNEQTAAVQTKGVEGLGLGHLNKLG